MQSELSKTQMYCSELHFPTEVLATNWQFPLFGHVQAVMDSFFFSFCFRARGALGRADFLLADVRSITSCNVVSVSTEIRTILGHVASPNQSRDAQKIRHTGRGGRDKSGFESALTKPFQSLSPSFRPGGFVHSVRKLHCFIWQKLRPGGPDRNRRKHGIAGLETADLGQGNDLMKMDEDGCIL